MSGAGNQALWQVYAVRVKINRIEILCLMSTVDDADPGNGSVTTNGWSHLYRSG